MSGQPDGDATKIYGEDRPIPWADESNIDPFEFTLDRYATVQQDGSQSISYLKTDYTNSYSLAPDRLDYTEAPVATGWSRNFDGSSLSPALTRTGVTQTDIYQQFSTPIWQASRGIARLEETRQRTYSMVEDGDLASYSYENPARDLWGGYQRSYVVTDYSGIDAAGNAWSSYDLSGRVNTNNVPVISENISMSVQDGFHVTETRTAVVNNKNVWANLGRIEVGTSTAWTWSSDEAQTGVEDDAGTFGADATPTYGEGNFDATEKNPVAQLDDSLSLSYSFTDLTQDIDDATGKALDVAPITTGWNWQYDGSAADPDETNIGFFKTDFVQVMNQQLWHDDKIQRVATSYSRGYTSDGEGDGSYDNPISDITGSFTRTYRQEDWSNSYGAFGRINRDAPPVVVINVSQSLSDGLHYTDSDTSVENNLQEWAKRGPRGRGGDHDQQLVFER